MKLFRFNFYKVPTECSTFYDGVSEFVDPWHFPHHDTVLSRHCNVFKRSRY